MEPDDIVGGGPQLDRQERPIRLGPDGKPLIPQRVPETRPTPLQNAFIYISIIGLVCGVIVIMALNLGAPMSSLVVKLPVLIGGIALLAVTVDATVRIWRSAFAWLPIDRGRGLFRFVWVAVLVALLMFLVAFMLVVLTA